MLETVVFADTENLETYSCDEIGCTVEDLDDYESWFSSLTDGCVTGRYIGDSGHYCDDHYPRCEGTCCA